MPLSLTGSLVFFSLIWLTQVMTPGPNFVRISHIALTVSRRAAMVTAAGTAAGNCSWCIAAALGAALLLQSPILTLALHLIGAIYFGLFGSRLLLAAYRGRKRAVLKSGVDVTGFRAFSAGYLTAIANPQAILFFATIFVTMFPALTATLIGIVLALVTAVTLGWYAFVTTILTAASARLAYERARPFIDLAFGILLWIAAIRLAWP